MFANLQPGGNMQQRPISASLVTLTVMSELTWWYTSSESRSVLESAREIGAMFATKGMSTPTRTEETIAVVFNAQLASMAANSPK